MDQLATGGFWYIAFLLSTSLHEAAHGFAALRLGDRTAYEAGQVTLDPIPHIRREPLGMVVVPLVSFLAGGWMIGWASVPFSREWASRYPRRSALMSLAGPASNLALALLAAIAIRLGMLFGVFVAPESINHSQVVAAAAGSGVFVPVALFVSVLFSLNLLLCIFNLLPVPPLDGSGAIPLFLGPSRAQAYLSWIRNPAFSLVGLVLAWRLFDVIYGPLHLFAINMLFLGVAHYR